MHGVGRPTPALTANVRGSVEYSFASAEWTDGPPVSDAVQLARFTPAALPTAQPERIHDLMTSIETEVPQTATRVVMFYRVNNGFVRTEGTEEVARARRALRVQVNQSLPFMNFMRSQWEMLVAVRNMFNETVAGASIYNEMLVVRPPKRIVGGLTVRF